VDAGCPDRVDIDDVRQVFDVVPAEVVGLDGGRLGALHVVASCGDDLVGAIRDPVGGITIGGATVRRVVFEAAVPRRVVARGDDDAVGLRAMARLVVCNDRVAECRRRHVIVELVDQHPHAVGLKHLECRGLCGPA